MQRLFKVVSRPERWLMIVCAWMGLSSAQAASPTWQYEQLKSLGDPKTSAVGPGAGVIRGRDGSFYGTTVGGGAGFVGTVFKLSENGKTLRVLHHFGTSETDGQEPYAKLLEGSDGAFYGTTRDGGAAGKGTVFKLRKDGTGYQILHSFGVESDDGQSPTAELIEGSDGFLYGTTPFGAVSGCIFKLAKNGADYQILHHDGGPSALLEGLDGSLYGITLGSLFKINKDGSSHEVLAEIGSQAALIQDQAGILYGTTAFDGTGGSGTVFKINPDGTGYGLLHEFWWDTGASPFAALLEGPDGRLYGSTPSGGSVGAGVIFALTKDGSGYEVLHHFGQAIGDGVTPVGSLIAKGERLLIGTTSDDGSEGGGRGRVYKINRDGTGYQILHTLKSFGGDGAQPETPLVRGPNGSLFGVSRYGGTFGLGTVFKIRPDGKGYRTLWSPTNVSMGATLTGLTVDPKSGDLYCTSYGGGFQGRGTVFRLNKNGGAYRLLRAFEHDVDGSNPGGLLRARDGMLYGVTMSGGTRQLGVVFKLAVDGSSFTVLHHFGHELGDGANPFTPLIQASDGLLYGTTWAGGTNYYGTIFRLNTNGGQYAVVYEFPYPGGAGAKPSASLLEGSDGRLFGTTYFGGSNDEGVLFVINKDGTGYTVLRDFDFPEGAYPAAALVEPCAGVLFGTTTIGNSTGTAFKINTDGTSFSVIHRFSSLHGQGTFPWAGFLPAPDGSLYGVTSSGGTLQAGTIFRLVPK